MNPPGDSPQVHEADATKIATLRLKAKAEITSPNRLSCGVIG